MSQVETMILTLARATMSQVETVRATVADEVSCSSQATVADCTQEVPVLPSPYDQLIMEAQGTTILTKGFVS